eukprot:22968_1
MAPDIDVDIDVDEDDAHQAGLFVDSRFEMIYSVDPNTNAELTDPFYQHLSNTFGYKILILTEICKKEIYNPANGLCCGISFLMLQNILKEFITLKTLPETTESMTKTLRTITKKTILRSNTFQSWSNFIKIHKFSYYTFDPWEIKERDDWYNVPLERKRGHGKWVTTAKQICHQISVNVRSRRHPLIKKTDPKLKRKGKYNYIMYSENVFAECQHK